MKKIKLLLLGAFFIFNSFAQVPHKISYQAIVRNNNNQLVVEKQVEVKISILKGSPDGASVYTEIQRPNTNSNGLLSIEIGTGNTVYDFSAINWADGEYFIKTEIDIDLSDGINYSITGTSQLLSVPYALYAERAGNVPDVEGFALQQALEDTASAIRSSYYLQGDLVSNSTLQDTAASIRSDFPDVSDLPTRSDLEELRSDIPEISGLAMQSALEDTAAAIRGEISDISELVTKTELDEATAQLRSEIPEVGNLATKSALVDTASSIRNDLDEINGSETKIVAGTNVNITGEGTSTKPYIISAELTNQHYIGELYGGGIVFFVDGKGEHGLVASLIDLSDHAQWWMSEDDSTGAASAWDGVANSDSILANGPSSAVAVSLALNYSYDGYSDWYLPALDELNLIYNVKYKLNKVLSTVPGASEFAMVYYWSSTEYSDDHAWNYRFNYGRASWEKKTVWSYVRAVREF